MTAGLWDELRRSTRARIGLGRAGNALPTAVELDFRAAHAAARDAVHTELDVAALSAQLETLGLGTPVRVASRAGDRGEYLRRPDLGRETDVLLAPAPADLAVVVADGLSPRAVQAHGVALLEALLPLLDLSVSTPVVATQARVALGDRIGAALGARAVIVLIGERPGLSVNYSLGAYLTYDPRPGRSDAERNCVSNIHAHGLSYAAAARVIAGLLRGSFAIGESGVRVKDRTRGALGMSDSPIVEQ